MRNKQSGWEPQGTKAPNRGTCQARNCKARANPRTNAKELTWMQTQKPDTAKSYGIPTSQREKAHGDKRQRRADNQGCHDATCDVDGQQLTPHTLWSVWNERTGFIYLVAYSPQRSTRATADTAVAPNTDCLSQEELCTSAKSSVDLVLVGWNSGVA